MEIKTVDVSWLKDAGPKREHGSIDELKNSIQEVGLLNPLTVNQDGKLLAGRRRFDAITQLGWTEIPVRILNSNGPVFDFKVALDENLKRKNLSDVEMAEALKEYQELKELEEGKAEPGAPKRIFIPNNILQCSELSTNRSQQKTAQEFGISQQAVSKAMKIAQAVEEYPDLRPLQKGSLILQAASKRQRLQNAKAPLPQNKFRTIYADPPWPFDDIATRGAAENHYPTMSISDICYMPVSGLVDDNAHLYLWTTNSHLPDAFSVIKFWGFAYKTIITWVKPQIGLGHYFRNATEHLLFCVRGNLPMKQVGERNWFEAPRQKHSQKPELFYELIEKCSPGPYIELFARQQREGWASWGNEVNTGV